MKINERLAGVWAELQSISFLIPRQEGSGAVERGYEVLAKRLAELQDRVLALRVEVRDGVLVGASTSSQLAEARLVQPKTKRRRPRPKQP